ncbi:PREDICTED: F-box protein DOR-like [Camelina sativa]|uniref:F-box protein DOR-like n=1 Tax=Camelina sativa TaxID=90675 RepID=A0ABM0WAJ5_CAMSA|nr:PREDICTED: F-box protein DOR-like [Camelina sativa]
MTRRRVALSSYLGYDPIEKQFKVLAMTFPFRSDDGISEEHQVLTLGGTGSWRMVQCCIPHCPGWKVICISGVLYYQAKVNMSSSCSMIVCFDVRSEKFSFIKVTEAFTSVVHHTSTLINYKGKLGSITTPDFYCVSGKTGAFVLCVLENPEKHEWSKHIYIFPPEWEHVFGQRTFHIVGVTRNNEVILSRLYPSDPFYVFYFNLEKKTIIRVQIQGMGAFMGDVYTFVDHVEDLQVKHLT